VHQTHTHGGIKPDERRLQEKINKNHATDPDDDGQKVQGLQGDVQHEKGS
jgi:hypothetical protein